MVPMQKSMIFCLNKTHPKFEITNESNRKLIRVIFCLFKGFYTLTGVVFAEVPVVTWLVMSRGLDR